MLYRISQIGTYLFIPLLMPLLALYLALRMDPYLIFFVSPAKGHLTLLVVCLATLIFPLVNLFLLMKAGVITDYHLVKRKERIAPAISTLVYFGLGYYLIKQAGLPTVVYSVYLGAVFSAFFAMLISLRWKISMHSIGIAGVAGAMYGLFKLHDFVNWPLLITLILISGWVMTSRVALQVHTPAQVYAGALLGFFVMLLTVVTGVVV